jgi:hypothetical protein
MRNTLVLIAVLVTIVLATTASAVQNAGPAWNQYAAQYGFASYPQASNVRFADAYSGNSFALDFAAILSRVSQAMNTHVPGLGGDDAFNASLENWADSSGT